MDFRNEQNMPVVDEQRLALALRLKTWPADAFSTRFQRMAARVITDASHPSLATGEVTPESAMLNATAWIERAYLEGRSDGREAANAAWRLRILGIFGL